MNEETVQTEEGTIYGDLSGAATEETETITTIQVIETVGSDIIHANLFGSFLICGTLVGLVLLRNIHGT